MTLRWDNKSDTQVSTTSMSKRTEGITCIIVIACSGFAAGILYRYGVSTLAYIFLILPVVIAILAAADLQFRHVSGVNFFLMLQYIKLFNWFLYQVLTVLFFFPLYLSAGV